MVIDGHPIDGCFEDVLQLGPLFFDVNCRLLPVIDSCFEDVLRQWSLFFVVDCRLPSDGVIDLLLEQQNTRRRRPLGHVPRRMRNTVFGLNMG